jgi:threonine/homoserine/homoserine lactone efflux protein
MWATWWFCLIQGIGYGFAAAMQPGPFQTYIVSQTLAKGWRHAIPAALAPLVSDGPIIALVLLVLSQVPLWFQRFLYMAGGLFVLYLAFQAIMAWRRSDGTVSATSDTRKQSVVRAAIVNALSPGPYIYWSLVTGPILLAAWREAPALGVGFLAGFYGAIVMSLCAIIVVFGVAGRLGPRVNRALLGISAVALVFFGVYQLWRGVMGT